MQGWSGPLPLARRAPTPGRGPFIARRARLRRLVLFHVEQPRFANTPMTVLHGQCGAAPDAHDPTVQLDLAGMPAQRGQARALDRDHIRRHQPGNHMVAPRQIG